MRLPAAEPCAAPPAAPAAPSGEGIDRAVRGCGRLGGLQATCSAGPCSRGSARRIPGSAGPAPCAAAAGTNGSHLFCFLSPFCAASAAVPLYLCSCLSLSECLSSSAFCSRVPADHGPAAQGEHSGGGRVPSPSLGAALRPSAAWHPEGLTGTSCSSGVRLSVGRWGNGLLAEPCPERCAVGWLGSVSSLSLLSLLCGCEHRAGSSESCGAGLWQPSAAPCASFPTMQ